MSQNHISARHGGLRHGGTRHELHFTRAYAMPISRIEIIPLAGMRTKFFSQKSAKLGGLAERREFSHVEKVLKNT